MSSWVNGTGTVELALHYSFQAALMDRLFGTEWKDWPALHAEIASGRSLQTLRETRD